MHVNPPGQSLPVPHDEDMVEPEDAAEHDVVGDAAQPPPLSRTQEAEAAAADAEREGSRSLPRTSEHHQTVLSFSSAQAASIPALTFSHPASTTIPPKKESVRCALCVQALCGSRFTCNGRISRRWCKCNHPPLLGTKKVRWSEAEVKRRIGLLEAAQGSSNE